MPANLREARELFTASGLAHSAFGNEGWPTT